jgi:putative transposase
MPGLFLPDHMHCIWTLPKEIPTSPAVGARDQDSLLEILGEGRAKIAGHVSPPVNAAFWQRRYWEHTISDDRDFAVHMDYTHFNPVKHGLVAHPADWPHSSFRRCVARGLYPAGWAGGSAEPQTTGERVCHGVERLAGRPMRRNALRFSALRLLRIGCDMTIYDCRRRL